MGVQGAVTDLAKLVTHQVVADQPSHVAGPPSHMASRHGVQLPLTISLGFRSTASWRVSR
jgi:hypothetical protein